jgi:hypothetical protein
MQWNRSNAIGIASPTCTYCHGYGTRLGRHEREIPCGCVLRAIFRACYARYRECVAAEARAAVASIESFQACEARITYSRKGEEFVADFDLVSRRVLDEHEYRIFRFHYLLGADWKLCCGRLKMERDDFFHALYRIEQILGRNFAEIRPYPLYPVNEYFGGFVRKGPGVAGEADRVRLPLSA